MADTEGMSNDRIAAYKRLVDTLLTPDDVSAWLVGHPAEEQVLDRLVQEVLEEEGERWDGME